MRLKHLLLCAAGWLAALLAQASVAGINTLTRIGPDGGSVFKVAFHPTDASIVYATTRAAFYRSTDGGLSWQLVNDRLLNEPRGVAVHPSQPNRVFVVTAAPGVWASSDAGATLSVLASSTGFQPSGRDIQYSADGSVLYVSTGQQVYRSTDHGTTWQRGGDLPAYAINLIVDPTDPNRLYMTGVESGGFQSADGGTTWQPWTVPSDRIRELAVANTSPARIWAAADFGTFFSDNEGAAWTLAHEATSVTVTLDPNDPNVIYSGVRPGLMRSSDNGVSWNHITDDTITGQINSVAVAPGSPNRVLVAGLPGLASSDDGGDNWTLRKHGFGAFDSSELVISPTSDRLYIRAQHDGVYAMSLDDSSTTTLVNGQTDPFRTYLGFDGQGLTVVPGSPDRLFLGTSTTFASSLDAGATWSPHWMTISDGVSRVVSVSSDGSRLLAATVHGYYHSNDGGVSWPRLSILELGAVPIMASAPSNPQVVYLVRRFQAPDASFGIFLRSGDGGTSWATCALPGTEAIALAIDPTNEQTLYATTNAGDTFKSTDGCATWISLPQRGHALAALAIDPQNPNIVYGGGLSRIVRSVDGGASWEEIMSDGLRVVSINSLVVDPRRPHRLYVGTRGQSLREFSVQPDLGITATVDDVPSAYGAAASYSYRISNAGPFDATNARARIQLPDGSTNISATSPAASCTVAGTVVTCTTPILRTNGSADITISATHPTSGNFAVVGTVEGDQADDVGANNSVTSNIRVTEMADLSAILTGSSIVAPGAAVTLSLRVTNAGPNDASVASVTLELAAGFGITSVTPSGGTSTCVISGSIVSCQLPQLGSGGSVTLTIVISASSTPGSFTHMATVTSSGMDVRGMNNVVSAVTTVSNVSQGIGNGGGSSGGGGGGSTSPFMLAALLLLSCMRAAANKFGRAAR